MSRRADDAERQHTVDVLRQHLVEGRLTLDEYADRVLAAYEAAMHADLDALVRDLPPLAPGAAARRVKARGRHGEAALPAVGWRPTQERFRDPTTDRVMRVWVDPARGTRHYVPDVEAGL